MKKREIKQVLEALRVVKMPKIEDKGLRNKLIRVHLKLLSDFRKYDEELEDARVVFLSAYKEDREEVTRLQDLLQTEQDRAKQMEIAAQISSYTEYLAAVRELNEKAEALGREPVQVEALDLESFVTEFEKQGYDLAVIEQRYPLFNAD